MMFPLPPQAHDGSGGLGVPEEAEQLAGHLLPAGDEETFGLGTGTGTGTGTMGEKRPASSASEWVDYFIL
jgi:hypothetical protein